MEPWLPAQASFFYICSPASLQLAELQVRCPCSAGHTAVAFVTTLCNDSVGTCALGGQALLPSLLI